MEQLSTHVPLPASLEASGNNDPTTHATRMEKDWEFNPANDIKSPAAVRSPTLSFTFGQFVAECVRNTSINQSPHSVLIVEAMIDEMINIGITPLAWAQTNFSKEMLKFDFIIRIPPVEDEEPNINYYGMPFSHTAFLVSEISATSELMKAVPSGNHTADNTFPDLFTLPDYTCKGMYELADMLDIMHAHGVSPKEYVTQLNVPCDEPSFLVCMEYADRLLPMRQAIRNRSIIRHMMLCANLIRKSVHNPTTNPTFRAFLKPRILGESFSLLDARPAPDDPKRRFVYALPVINI
ncbi:hypothetical protein G6011_06622 [Alternaria panax]|uniref:Uncharacterized protein n=1 Tax=Alternaria panax TaxID=48097 RepID=A0AAD4FLN1_9PLEO|nr:hypothetical protein G6011_06622 [Alternaria panax]